MSLFDESVCLRFEKETACGARWPQISIKASPPFAGPARVGAYRFPKF